MENKFGDLVKEYVTSFENTSEMFTLVNGNMVLRESFNLINDYKANLMSFKLYWILEGKHISRHLPRKKKKRLARMFKNKYNKLRKEIYNMEK